MNNTKALELTDKQLEKLAKIAIGGKTMLKHNCTQPITRSCWDCSFCGDRANCSCPVDGYGNPVIVKAKKEEPSHSSQH